MNLHIFDDYSSLDLAEYRVPPLEAERDEIMRQLEGGTGNDPELR
jgi:hypothetical protein